MREFEVAILIGLYEKSPAVAIIYLGKSINLSDMVSVQHTLPLAPLSHANEDFTRNQAQNMRKAIKTHNFPLVNQLLRDGFNPAQPITPDRWNAYLLLVLEGCSELVKELIEAGEVDVNYKDEDGFTGLMVAADHGDLKMVQTLVSLGADLKATYDGRHTAKSLAIQASRQPVAVYLQTQESR